MKQDDFNQIVHMVLQSRFTENRPKDVRVEIGHVVDRIHICLTALNVGEGYNPETTKEKLRCVYYDWYDKSAQYKELLSKCNATMRKTERPKTMYYAVTDENGDLLRSIKTSKEFNYAVVFYSEEGFVFGRFTKNLQRAQAAIHLYTDQSSLEGRVIEIEDLDEEEEEE